MYDFFVRSGLSNFHTAYLTDWAVALLCFGLGSWIDTTPVFERDFTIDDPLINHPHTKQRVNYLLLSSLALYLPLVIIIVAGALKRSWVSMHHGSLGLFLSLGTQRLIVIALKNRVGRLRPDFLARCKWDNSLEACTGKSATILDGRRSFPSGHSSLAFAGLTFLSIFIGSHVCAFRSTSTSTHVPSFLLSRPLRLFIAVLPLGIATWVAITRLEDYRHHKEDVITGGLIGATCAYVFYGLYWQSPFSGNYGPRAVYANEAANANSGYELAEMDDPSSNV